jgi:hypothetical protein
VTDREPDEVHLPGIFVDRVVPVGRVEKRIEKTVTLPASMVGGGR